MCFKCRGGTQQNAKRQNLLDVKIPFPTIKNNKKPQEIEKYVSLLTQNIIDKEEWIIEKQVNIDKIIYKELSNNQKTVYKYKNPTISNIINNNRLDTGLCTHNYQSENSLITNYKNGYYTLHIDDFNSGSTPKVRLFNGQLSYLKWVTPTNISDEGFFNPTDKISTPLSNNLKNDYVLFINRTSKGKKGEYVGICCFYDFEFYGPGHHNQGVYRVNNSKKEEMLFITAFMNSRIMRKLCGNISTGSKMKEMKSYDFANIKFPKLPSDIKKKVVRNYYNKKKDVISDLNSYLDNEKKRNKELGIFQLNTEIIKLKTKLEDIVRKIINNEPIVIEL